MGRGGVSFFGYGPTGYSGGWKLWPRWHRLMGAVVTPGWPVTLPCARVNLPWPMGRLPAQPRCAITIPVAHRWFCAPGASALTDGRCSAGQERPCRYSLGPIDHPEKTGRYQPALPYVRGVWCLCCAHYVHTPQLPRQGPKPAAGCTRAQLCAFPGRVWVQISARNRQNHPLDPD